MLMIMVVRITMTMRHSSYLSQPPQPAVVYFFSAGVLFRIMNAKFWPILSHCDQVRLYFRECKHFLVYFLQAHIMWWCIKIDKYGVCTAVTPRPRVQSFSQQILSSYSGEYSHCVMATDCISCDRIFSSCDTCVFATEEKP